jgi:small-conductance mechanosensitive channel
VRIGITAIFIVFILQRLGFDTTAIITGLGVGGIAVALALQDTLGNFFGGVHILVDKPFKEEDYIKTDNGVEGQVKQIGWRTTKVETFPSRNLIIVPNSKIANAVLENFSFPEQETGVVGTVGVDYKEDVERVEQVIRESLEIASEKSGLIEKNSVWVRFDNFGDFSLNFRYGFLVKGWANRAPALSGANKEIFNNFKKKQINIPFPVRTIYNVNNKETIEKKTSGKTESNKK